MGVTPPGGAITITENGGGARQLAGLPSARTLDCLFDRHGTVIAALFAPEPGHPAGEIVVYDAAGASSSLASGRVLAAPAMASSFQTLPFYLRDQITDLLYPTPEEPTQEAGDLPTPDPAALKAASYNPPRPAPANLTENLRVIRRTYDDFERLESETVDLEGGGTGTIRYTYYRNSLRKTVTDTVGRVTFYEYNGVNLLSRVTTNYGLPDAQVTSYDYWPDKLLKAIHWPNGLDTAYDYDNADRLTTITVTRGQTRLAAYDYGYDANGNRTSQVEENGGASERTSYQYDDLDRLRLVRYPDGRSVEYGYDAVGNRTSETTRNAAGAVVSDKTAAFDPINRLSTVTDAVDPSGNASFTYDRNGNLRTKTTAAGVQEYVYDTRDLLVETRDGTSITARFAYDAFGRRYLKIGEEGVRQYLFDQTSVLEELDEHDVEVAKYEYGSTQLQSFFRRDEPRRYYHLDVLGSVTGLSDAGGDMVARYHLDAWGNFRDAMELEASRNRFAFTGYQWDRETELYYAKARFYDPVYGRFTTQDSFLGRVEEPPSLHRYFYASGNPGRYVDPTGHEGGNAGCYYGPSSCPGQSFGMTSVDYSARGAVRGIGNFAKGLVTTPFKAINWFARLDTMPGQEMTEISKAGDPLFEAGRQHVYFTKQALKNPGSVQAAINDLGPEESSRTMTEDVLGTTTTIAAVQSLYRAARAPKGVVPGDAPPPANGTVLEGPAQAPPAQGEGPQAPPTADRQPGAPVETSPARDPLYSRGTFRRAVVDQAKREAPKNDAGEMTCPTCQKVMPDTITVDRRGIPMRRRGFDLDHFDRTWAERVREMQEEAQRTNRAPTRQEVLDEYNRTLRAQCPSCNQSHQFEASNTPQPAVAQPTPKDK